MECFDYISPPQSVFQLFVPRGVYTKKEKEDLNRNEKMNRIIFNPQYALLRIVLDQYQ